MANVGNLKVQLTLSAQQFAASLQSAGGNLNQFAMQVQSAQTQVTRVAPATIQASRGVTALTSSMGRFSAISGSAANGLTDFISQLGTRGLGGGLMAAANNIQQVGAAFGPWGMIISSAAAVATQGLGIYLEQTNKAKQATKDLAKEAEAALSQMEQLALARIEATGRVREAAARGETTVRRVGEDTSGMSAAEIDKRRMDAIRRAEDLQTEQSLIRSKVEDIIGPAFQRLFGKIATPEFLGITGKGGTDFNQLQQMLEQFPELRSAIGKERMDALLEINRTANVTGETLKQTMRESKALEEAFKKQSSAESQNKDAEAAERQKLIREEESQRRLSAEQAMKEVVGQTKAAPGIGAFGTDTQQGFSMIQAALRTAKDVKNPQLDTISGNTRKTAENTRDIAKTVKRFKVATIA